MATDPVGVTNPQRWDMPFGHAPADADIDYLLTVPPFNQLDPTKFPPALPLRGILRNDARLARFQSGDIIVRYGEYGSSAFFILSGAVRLELGQLPPTLLGRNKTQKKSIFQAVAQMWSNHRQPEVRDPSLYHPEAGVARRGHDDEVRIFLQDVPGVLDKYHTARMEAGQMFGELAALGRTPRTATVFAEGDVVLLEMRWQGLRDIMRRDDGLRRHVDQLFRERALVSFLRTTPLFRSLDADALADVAAHAQLTTYGRYDRAGTLRELAAGHGESALDPEEIIAEEGASARRPVHGPNGPGPRQPPCQPWAPHPELSGPRTLLRAGRVDPQSGRFGIRSAAKHAARRGLRQRRVRTRSAHREVRLQQSSRRARPPCRWPRPRLPARPCGRRRDGAKSPRICSNSWWRSGSSTAPRP